MDKIGLKNFRRIYYTGMILLIILISSATGLSLFRFQKNEYNRRSSQLRESIMEQKKLYLQSIIREKFSDILFMEHSLNKQEEEKLTLALALYSEKTRNALTLTPHPNWESLFFRENNMYRIGIGHPDGGEIWNNGDSPLTNNPSLNRSSILQKDYLLSISLRKDYFDEKLKENILFNLTHTELPDNEYIWVNQVIDYNGGDNYAIRLLHPNLPHTEGDFLSTNTTDINGNKPYLEELEGVKEKGEIIFDYYFKEKTSNRISHKLSYARLCEKFDWIIATGVYLNDVDALIQREQEKMDRIFQRELQILMLTTSLIIFIALIALNQFEKLLQQAIREYTKRLEEAKNKLEIFAFMDPLTNLLNRRAIYDRLNEEIARSTRFEKEFCLIIADLDNFKKINDTLGHQAGDRVLTELAKLLKKEIRANDALGRWGGEEFLILLESTDLKTSVPIGEKLRRAVENYPFRWETEEIKVTLTMGVTQYRPGESIEDTIQRADENLYKGKNAGRNRVVS
ncbi:MAG: sensor domain-containing diguanylate cyclase [Spirochaetales bacterium]|nr:sensor domain-containing diguanylate cyclase [Spirochaetales bacterium]